MRLVHTKVDVTETATTNFAADSVLVADAEVLLGVSLVRCRDALVGHGDDGDDHDGNDKKQWGLGGAYHCRHGGRRFNLEEVGPVVRVKWWVGRGR